MRIAVVDIAAVSGGAKSILFDLYYFIKDNNEMHKEMEWFFYTSLDMPIDSSIRVVKFKNVKKTWIHRLAWEKLIIRKQLEIDKIDIVISLQNTAIKKGNYRQIVYFHNVLLLEDKKKFSFWLKDERLYYIYTRFIAPYTINSLKNAQIIIVQSESVKNKLRDAGVRARIEVITPNIQLEKKYINTAKLPIKGIIYPTSPVVFKRIEELVKCVINHYEWFKLNDFEILITISGNENNYARKIRNQIEGYETVIKLVGWLGTEMLYDYYSNHAVFTCSELESFCIPLAEASIIGTPIIAANYDYAVERTKSSNNAFLYTPKNDSELFANIEKIASIKELLPNYKCGDSENSWCQLMKIIDENNKMWKR